MIKVIYRFDNNHYSYLSVKGHANSDEYGKDLICASVSSIMFGLMNAIDMVDSRVVLNDHGNELEIINDTNDLKIDNYLELAILQLKTIEESYSQYIKIDERRK